jgi:hypothetical protein
LALADRFEKLSGGFREDLHATLAVLAELMPTQ